MHRNLIAGIGILLMILSVAANSTAGTRDACVSKCKEAAAYVSSEGINTAIKEMAKRDNRFTWNDGVSYVFLMDMDCNMLAHPVKPELTRSKKLLQSTDVNGKPFFVDFINAAAKGKGWTKYKWPVPGQEIVKPKHTFIYRIPDTDYFVGAGFYVMSPGVFY